MPSGKTCEPLTNTRLPVLLACVAATRTNTCFQMSVTSTPPPNAVSREVPSTASKLSFAAIVSASTMP